MSKAKGKPDIRFTRLLRRTMPLVCQASPAWFAGSNLVNVVHGAMWGVSVLAMQWFFDAVAKVVSGGARISHAFALLAVLGAVSILQQFLNGYANFSIMQFMEKSRGHMQRILHAKTARIDPVCFEDPGLLDDINKAEEGMANSGGLVFVTLTIFTFYLPYFLFMAIYMMSLKPLLALVIPLVFVPVALSQLLRGILFTRLEDESAPIRRQSDYYERAICDREFFKETRLLGAFRFFRELFTTVSLLLTRKKWQTEFKTALAELGMRLLALGGYGGILALLVTSLLAGEISVGAFSAVFTSVGMLFGVMEEIVCRHIGELSRNLGTVRNFVRFLDLPERPGENKAPEVCDIKLDDVSFSYPGREAPAVDHVSLRVKTGQTIAIVGENGSGKTTLVRLMTGLYLPSCGSVLIGGADTRERSAKSLFSIMSGVFQKYQRYKLTLDENISISQLADHKDGAAVNAALAKARIKLDENFPDGLQTVLSREFDGVDLSGGQWQRVAIARGFFRMHDLIVLDEPTAAIDPIEETRIYRQFADASLEKTAIIVTHRLGAARIADWIFVLDGGRLAEQGTHDDLVGQDGLYAAMYQAQAKWYVEKT